MMTLVTLNLSVLQPRCPNLNDLFLIIIVCKSKLRCSSILDVLSLPLRTRLIRDLRLIVFTITIVV
jgi:hypothetical protein